MTVYLVRIKSDGGSWRNLFEQPTYYGSNIVSGTPPTNREGTLFAASACGGRCRIEWLGSRTSPLPGGATRLDLGHGETVEFDKRAYLVYVEPEGAEWSAIPPTCLDGPSAEALTRLRQLPNSELAEAASRFLGLPYTSAWWGVEFATRTRFEQCRDGQIPVVRDCSAVLGELGVELRWEVQVWDMFKGAWTNRPERASFVRVVFSDDLLRLLDCATRLRALARGP